MKDLKKKITNNKVIITYITISIIITYTLMNLPSIFKGGVTSDWIGFWGNLVGSFLGILGAFIVVKYQLREEKKKDLEEKKPKLIIGVENYKNKKIKPGYDLGDEDTKLNYRNKLSKITVPLINGGLTPVFNLKFYYEIVDYNEVFSYYEEYSDENEMEVRRDFHDSKYKLMIAEKYSDSIYSIYSRTDDVSVIMPGEKIDLNMPKVFIQLIKFYFSNIYTNRLINDEVIYKIMPVLKITVVFEDYEMKESIFEYYIRLGNNNSLSDRHDGKYVTFSLRRINKSYMEKLNENR